MHRLAGGVRRHVHVDTQWRREVGCQNMEAKGSGCRVSDLEEHSIPLLTTLEHLLCSVLQWGLTSHSNMEKAQGISRLAGRQASRALRLLHPLLRGRSSHAVGEEPHMESTWKNL